MGALAALQRRVCRPMPLPGQNKIGVLTTSRLSRRAPHVQARRGSPSSIIGPMHNIL
jgi:hypothetical protein